MKTFLLSQIEDTLDPDLVEAAKQILPKISTDDDEKGGGRMDWYGEYTEEDKHYEFSMSLYKKKEIEEIFCNCRGAENLEMEAYFCVHTTALALFVKNSQVKKPAKTVMDKTEKKPKAIPKAKPKDPAEQILSELEAKEIYEFVRQAITKNAEFKSYFLVHFSDKTSGTAQQYHDILAAAIKSERGRKKYMKGGDVAKILTKLTPIYKQAQQSEAKGLLREVMNIADAFLTAIPPLLDIMETESQKFFTFVNNSIDLLGAVGKNPSLSFEMREELFEMLMKYQKQWEERPMALWAERLFEYTEEVGKKLSKAKEIFTLLNGAVEKPRAIYQSGKYHNWQVESVYAVALKRLLDFCNKNREVCPDSITILEENKVLKLAKELLVEEYVKVEQFQKALDMLDGMKSDKNGESYHSFGNERKDNLNKKAAEILAKEGDVQKSKVYLANFFKESEYRNFDFYKALKALCTSQEWEEQVKTLLKATEKARFEVNYQLRTPYFEILEHENQDDEICKKLLEVSNLKILARYGKPLYEKQPDIFIKHASAKILATKGGNYFPVEDVCDLFNILKKLPKVEEVCIQILRELVAQKKVTTWHLTQFKGAGYRI